MIVNLANGIIDGITESANDVIYLLRKFSLLPDRTDRFINDGGNSFHILLQLLQRDIVAGISGLIHFS